MCFINPTSPQGVRWFRTMEHPTVLFIHLEPLHHRSPHPSGCSFTFHFIPFSFSFYVFIIFIPFHPIHPNSFPQEGFTLPPYPLPSAWPGVAAGSHFSQMGCFFAPSFCVIFQPSFWSILDSFGAPLAGHFGSFCYQIQDTFFNHFFGSLRIPFLGALDPQKLAFR